MKTYKYDGDAGLECLSLDVLFGPRDSDEWTRLVSDIDEVVEDTLEDFDAPPLEIVVGVYERSAGGVRCPGDAKQWADCLLTHYWENDSLYNADDRNDTPPQPWDELVELISAVLDEIGTSRYLPLELSGEVYVDVGAWRRHNGRLS